ncbi:MAG: hypothetical protein AAGL68_07910 [Pseudomonadota bacterium]
MIEGAPVSKARAKLEEMSSAVTVENESIKGMLDPAQAFGITDAKDSDVPDSGQFHIPLDRNN